MNGSHTVATAAAEREAPSIRRWTAANGGSNVMIPALAPLACLLLGAGHNAGGGWWLFHADSTVVPFDPNGAANGGPGPFSLPPGRHCAWWRDVSGQIHRACLPNLQQQ